MFNKGRCPNLRHVTRTDRVDFEWLFERKSLDHSLLIKYVRTNDQLVDMLTKGTFTTVQWHSFIVEFVANQATL